MWPTSLKKPVLFPLIAPDGVTVTRGYPLAPQDTERVDHPHHAGLWFNYGNANGFDFWNNSDAIKPENRGKMGTIHHEKVISVKSGSDGELVVDSVWETGAGKKILNQKTKYVFSQKGDARTIDMTVTLQALDKVVFHDDKEGVLGIRVAHFLESPTEKGRHLRRRKRTGDEGGRQYRRSHRSLSNQRRSRGRRGVVDSGTLV